MKLKSINLARAIWFFPINDLNPRGKSVWPQAIGVLAQRYAFVKVPSLPDVVDGLANNKGVTFSGGTFRAPDGEDVIVDVTVYREGVVCDTRSGTENCDSFLTEVTNWLHSEFQLENARALAARRTWFSELYVEMTLSLSRVNEGLEQLAQKLSGMVGSMGKAPSSIEVGSIGLWFDQDENQRFADFRFERARDVPFSNSRYFSSAPVQTSQHLELLQDLENLLND